MIDAGKLRYPVTILTPGTGEDKGRWVQLRRAYADKEDSTRTTVFSSVGLAARTAIFTLRRQTIHPGDVIQWMGQWYYITAWEETERIWLTVTSAAVFPVECSAVRGTETMGPDNRPVREETALGGFTGILTEKYAGFSRQDAYGTVEQTFVLVTTKGMELKVADLVTLESGSMGGNVFNITACHVLDPSRNEYELSRKEDA